MQNRNTIKKHYSITGYFANYLLVSIIFVVIAAILIKIGANEDRLAKFIDDHRTTFNFLQAYIAYYLTESWREDE